MKNDDSFEEEEQYLPVDIEVKPIKNSSASGRKKHGDAFLF